MKWPLVSRSRHDRELDRYHELLMAAYDLIGSEYDRAVKDGTSKVHAFMRDANASLFTAEGSSMYVPKVRAVFQQAEREFRPEPLSVAERLTGPANIEEAINAAVRS